MYAVESAGRLKRRELVPLIIPQLGNPVIQQVASKALENYGEKIIGTLKDYLSDPEQNIKVRKAIPHILSRIGTQRAADVLSLELSKEEKNIRFVIIEALYKMRTNNPDIRFQENVVAPEIMKEIKRSYLIVIEIFNKQGNKKKDLLVSDLENNLARSLKNIFELLTLIYPQDDIDRAYQNICKGTSKTLDYSMELLDNILKRDLNEFLLPLIDDLPFEDRVKRCKKQLKALEKV